MTSMRSWIAALLALATLISAPIGALADTTTTNLGLTKPAIGADDSTWGTLVDADYDLLDAEFNRTAVGNANYSILTTDRHVALTASLSTPRTWTLPAANSRVTGQPVVIIDEAGGISATNTLTIAAAGSDTINGAATLVLTTAHQVVMLRTDGTSKWTVNVSTPSCALTGCTFTGKVNAVASATGGAGLNLGLGAAPTSPVDGDLWITSGGVLSFRATATRSVPQLATSNSFTQENTFGGGGSGQAAINLTPQTAPSSPINGDIWTTSGGVFGQVNGSTQKLAPSASGSLTPTFAYVTPGTSSFSYALQTGGYVCSGGVVSGWVSATFTPTNGTASNQLLWSNAPYSSTANFGTFSYGISSAVSMSGTWSGLATAPYFMVGWSGNTFAIGSFSGTTTSLLQTANTTSGSSKTLSFVFSYPVSAC